MNKIILFFLTLNSSLLFSQQNPGYFLGERIDTAKISAVIKNMDVSKQSIKKFAQAINDNCDSDVSKVYMLYSIIGEKFKYDLTRFKDIKRGKVKRDLFTYELIKKKKGTCSDFAWLFKEVCDSLHIPSFHITGHSPVGIFGKVTDKKTNHAWNVVCINSHWYPIDATWGIRQFSKSIFNQPSVNYLYLFSDPKFFNLTHLPSDPIFQLIGNPMGYKDFKKQKKVVYQSNYVGIEYDSILNARFLKPLYEQVEMYAQSSLDYNLQHPKIAINYLLLETNRQHDPKYYPDKKMTVERLENVKKYYQILAELAPKVKKRKYRKLYAYSLFKQAEIEKEIEKLKKRKSK